MDTVTICIGPLHAHRSHLRYNVIVSTIYMVKVKGLNIQSRQLDCKSVEQKTSHTHCNPDEVYLLLPRLPTEFIRLTGNPFSRIIMKIITTIILTRDIF